MADNLPNNFEFYNPVHIVFGVDQTDRIGELTSGLGKRALVVTTRGKVEELGILKRVEDSLKAAGVEYRVFKGVQPNPRLSTVLKGAKEAKDFNADVIVAVGGGSVIDCSKCIAYAVYEPDDADIWELFLGKRTADKSLPIVTLTTITGTGSEMNTNCVITNDLIDPPEKYATHYAHSFPKYAVIDPSLYASIPEYLTACGMADTIAHVLEKYFVDYGNTPVQDRLAEGIVSTVFENDGVLKNPDDITARANLAWASTMALNGLNDAGRGAGEYDGHTIGMVMSARYDAAHGASLSPVIPALMEHRVSRNPKKYAQFAIRVMGVDPAGKTDEEIGIEGARKLKEKFASWGLPVTIRELKVPEEDLESIAEGALLNPEGYTLTKEEVWDILKSAY